MPKTNRERILDYLWSVGPRGATNSQIRQATGISSHQQVYMLTRELAGAGLIYGERRGSEWRFWNRESVAAPPGRPAALPLRQPRFGTDLTARSFEELAQVVLSRHYGCPLMPGESPGVPNLFDLVSADRRIVGDAKFFTMVRGKNRPPAKFAIIAEHVWLLEKTGAPVTFLVFGNDRQVPELWLKRFGHLVGQVVFYFLSDDGTLEELTRPEREGNNHADL